MRKHSEETKKKISETLKRKYESGEKKIWNKGLDISDERIKKNVDTAQETLKNKRESGKLVHWAKGLTKETDDRIKKQSESSKLKYQTEDIWCKGKTKETDEGIKKRSETQKKMYEDGYVSPNIGRKHTDEYKNSKSIEMKNKYARGEKISYFATHPTWNKGLTKETNDTIKQKSEQMISDYATGKRKAIGKGETKETNEMIKNRSEKVKQKILNGEFIPQDNYKAKIEFVEDLGHIVRSGWEKNVCRYLRMMNVNYEYEPKSFKLKLGSGEYTTYTPDIFIPSNNLYIEVKGFEGIDGEHILKYNLFKEQYPEYNTLLINSDIYEHMFNNNLYYTNFNNFLNTI